MCMYVYVCMYACIYVPQRFIIGPPLGTSVVENKSCFLLEKVLSSKTDGNGLLKSGVS